MNGKNIALIVLVVLAGFCLVACLLPSKKKEGFNYSGMNPVGLVATDGYNRVPAAEMAASSNYPGAHFADVAPGTGDQYELIESFSGAGSCPGGGCGANPVQLMSMADVEANRVPAVKPNPVGAPPVRDAKFANSSPMERMGRYNNSHLMPKSQCNSVTPWDISVADPNTYLFRTSMPRVNLFTRQARQADAIRGDIPITINPDIALISTSQYGRDSLRLDGFFSQAFTAMYDKITGQAYCNMPANVSYGETLMDAGRQVPPMGM